MIINDFWAKTQVHRKRNNKLVFCNLSSMQDAMARRAGQPSRPPRSRFLHPRYWSKCFLQSQDIRQDVSKDIDQNAFHIYALEPKCLSRYFLRYWSRWYPQSQDICQNIPQEIVQDYFQFHTIDKCNQKYSHISYPIFWFFYLRYWSICLSVAQIMNITKNILIRTVHISHLNAQLTTPIIWFKLNNLVQKNNNQLL